MSDAKTRQPEFRGAAQSGGTKAAVGMNLSKTLRIISLFRLCIIISLSCLHLSTRSFFCADTKQKASIGQMIDASLVWGALRPSGEECKGSICLVLLKSD